MANRTGSLRFIPRTPPETVAPGGDALLAVANVTALAALDATTVDDGGVVSMASVLDFWMLNRNSTLVPDAITVVAANGGGGNWERLKIPNPTWQAQTTWYLDEGTGDDENDGSLGNAIATFAEFTRRVGQGPIAVDMTVNITSSLAQDLIVETLTEENAGSLTLQGTRSAALYSGSVTGLVSQNPAGNQDLQVTDAAIPVSWTASGLVNKLVVLTSGPNAGAVGWVAKDLGANTARMTVFYNETAGTYVEPAVGETFDVVDLGEVDGQLIGIEAGALNMVVKDLSFVPAGTSFESYGGFWDFSRCNFEGSNVVLAAQANRTGFVESVRLRACRIACSQPGRIGRASANMYACLLNRRITIRASGELIIHEDTMYQDPGSGSDGIIVDAGGLFLVRNVGTYACFDARSGAALETLEGATARLQGLLWGTGNTFDYALKTAPNSAISYTSGVQPVVVTAAVADATISGEERDYADLPATNLNQLSGVIED